MTQDDTYFLLDDTERMAGTSYHGSHFKASEKELFELFGEWPLSNDPEIGWVFGGPGSPITVYLHNVTDIMPARTWVIDWHIGGRNGQVTGAFLDWVEARLAEHRASKA